MKKNQKPIIPNLEILEGKKRKEIIDRLNEQFGIKEIPGMLLVRGKERIFLFTGNYNEEKLRKLEEVSFVERAGVYLGKVEEKGIRLSIEGSEILKDQIKKCVVELNKEEMQTWMMGHEVLKESGKTGFVIIKYKDDMLGTGKASAEKITNFIPKSRRLKDKTIEN